MTERSEIDLWFEQIANQELDHRVAIDVAHTQLRNAGLLSKVTTHKYLCRKGCPIATVFRVGGLILCAVRDYKYSPGLNERESVPRARETATLDGNRHWPAHVYDVEDLNLAGPRAQIHLACRHFHGTLLTHEILATVRGVDPGHPTKPTRLGG